MWLRFNEDSVAEIDSYKNDQYENSSDRSKDEVT